MAKKKRNKGKKNKRRVEVHYVQAKSTEQQGMMAGLARLLPENASEQFLIGAAIGGAAAYVLGDEAARAKVMRFAIKTYGDLVGGLAELKEQAADIQAEILAEKHEPT